MKKKKIAIGLAVFALALGGGITYYNSQNQVPELITYVDTDGSIEIPDEDVPLAKSTLTFVDLDDQISIDEDEVPLAKAHFALGDTTVPQIIEYFDPEDGSIVIPEEEVPL